MLLSENFLQPLIIAHGRLPLICGQLFKFVEKDQQFVVIKKRSARDGFQVRWILFALISLTFLIRILLLGHPDIKLSSPDFATLDRNMSILMFATTMVVVEHYRVRCTFPQEFVSFLNGALRMEKKYIKCEF